MTTLIRATEVIRPTPTPVKSSVLDHATTPADIGSFGLRNNNGLWPSYNCLDTLVPTPICPDPAAEKEFSFAEWVPAFEFAYQAGVQCRTVGLDRNDMKTEILRVFQANEGKGIEQALRLNRFVATGSPADPDAPAWGDPVDLTSTGMTLLGALAVLEGYAAANYAGQPTIHMPRAAALILTALGAIKDSDGLLYTKTGAKVAAGGGYDDLDPAPASGVPGVFTLHATGEVYVERSGTVDVTDVHVLPGDGSAAQGLVDNTVIGLVERIYRVGVDCFVAKATGTVWS